MTCRCYRVVTVDVLDRWTGNVYRMIGLAPDPDTYRACLLRLERFVTGIVTAGGRRSWVLNSLFHSRRVYPVYARIKKAVLYGRGEGRFVDCDGGVWVSS